MPQLPGVELRAFLVSGPGLRRAIPFLALLAVALLALALRLNAIGFGFPALYDPDEPVFELLAVHLLKDSTLNPGWFGHPGTTTIYSLALVDIGTFAAGWLTGRWADLAAFGAAVYADPAVIFLPGRVFIALCGVACVVLTAAIGRRLDGPATGLLAGLILALDPTHIAFSQIIRTDVHASVFMLAAILAALGLASTGRRRAAVWAGVWTGLACATKWPAAAVGLCALGALAWRAARVPAERATLARHAALLPAVALATLVAASPFLVLDWRTLLQDIAGQALRTHVGANGGGPLFNLGWYAAGPLRASFGVLGLALATAGLVIGARRHRALAWVVLPGPALFALTILLNPLVWARWVVPLLPYCALGAAIALAAVARAVHARAGARPAGLAAAAATVALTAPMLATAYAQATERRHDTRALASAWVRANVPAGSTIAVEHAAFDLMTDPYRFVFPLGTLGCVDVRAMLGQGPGYTKVDRARTSSAAIDLGSVAPDKRATCRTGWVIATNYGRYLAEAPLYAREIAQYRALFAGGTVRAVFRPVPGRVGGPVVHIVGPPPTPPPPAARP